MASVPFTRARSLDAGHPQDGAGHGRMIVLKMLCMVMVAATGALVGSLACSVSSAKLMGRRWMSGAVLIVEDDTRIANWVKGVPRARRILSTGCSCHQSLPHELIVSAHALLRRAESTGTILQDVAGRYSGLRDESAARQEPMANHRGHYAGLGGADCGGKDIARLRRSCLRPSGSRSWGLVGPGGALPLTAVWSVLLPLNLLLDRSYRTN